MNEVVGAGDYIRFALALVFVIGLIGLVSYILRRYGGSFAYAPRSGAQRRLHVSEALSLDARHRLFLVRRDDKEHLLLLGPQGSIVVENGIDTPAETRPSAARMANGNPTRSIRFQSMLNNVIGNKASRDKRKSNENDSQTN